MAGTFPTGKAIGYGLLIWVVGFVWGTVVFMTPALKALPSIPYVSRYPAITFPLLIVFPVQTFWFAKNTVQASQPRREAGVKTGIIFAGLNVLLDVLVLVMAFKAGWGYFAFASIWVAYALLLFIPVAIGRIADSWY